MGGSKGEPIGPLLAVYLTSFRKSIPQTNEQRCGHHPFDHGQLDCLQPSPLGDELFEGLIDRLTSLIDT